MNLRKIALVTGIALALGRGYAIVSIIQSFSRDFRWIYLLPLLTYAMFLIPLPVLLVILYRSDAPLTFSPRLKIVALATVLVQAALFTALQANGWVQRLAWFFSDLRLGSGKKTGAAGLWDWLTGKEWGPFLGSTTALLAEGALIVLLIAIYRYQESSPLVSTRPSRLLTEAAALATMVGGLAVILQLLQVPVTLIRMRNQLSLSRGIGGFMLGGIIATLPPAASMLAAYILYRGSRDAALVAELTPSEPQ